MSITERKNKSKSKSKSKSSSTEPKKQVSSEPLKAPKERGLLMKNKPKERSYFCDKEQSPYGLVF
jgi:hypothetical protein